MPTNVFIREGLTQREMAEVAQRYRRQFNLEYAQLVDIVEILEFKLPEAFPGFVLVIRRQDELSDPAITEVSKNRILVREDIYDNACEGDSACRFILAHELGHFLLHRDKGSSLHKSFDTYVPQIPSMDARENGEDQADIFARHFLIHPSIAFRYKNNISALAEVTKTPTKQARASATVSKRQEMYQLRNNFVQCGD